MTAHFTLVQTSKSYQVDKSQSTALASSHPFSHTNNKWVPFEWAGHFWRYHLTRFEALCMQLEHTKHMAHYWKQQWRKASRQQLYSNWIVTLPQVSHSVSGLIPTILILFLLIRDLFWLFGSSTQANSSFPSFVERWYQISRHLDFQLNGLFMIKINSHHFKDFSGPANHTTQNETLGLRPG